ncbi:MAG: aminomethyl-transferring glycine dehydrogenase subunit GcvPB [Lentisphaerae bacterium]|nr:aminomethyl-transferring glycine dehydrogenase subunit GcvPB [Lentisphaerota bacterium]
MQLIYEKSVPGRRAVRAPRLTVPAREPINKKLLRARPAALPEMPELEIVRHFTNLSRRNFSIDTNFYPLGSCTMKYNPKACETAAAHPGFTQIHPLWPQLRGGGQLTQGALCLLYETERMLSESFDVVSIPSTPAGTVDVERLKAVIDGDTAGMMMTNPNTLGLFEPEIEHIAELIHAAGGLMYYDGANLNAILGRCKPADMGFDVCHLNLHKTFATPHGGGGPGAGPVGVTARLRPFLPISRVIKKDDGTYALDYEHPKSIGYIAPFYGNFGVLVRTYAYCLMVGRDGLRDISNHAVLNANYLLAKLREFFPANYAGNCMHEFVLSARPAGPNGVRALDLAKGLIDRGIHPPTVYFPLIVPEAMMIEPTETETRETLDRFVEVMRELAAIARDNPAELKNAPVTTPVGRLDEVAAARNMNLACLPPDE